MTMILDGTLGETFPSWTTSGRPASPVVGQMGYNTTIGQFDAYTSSGWVSIATTTSTSNKVTTSQLPVGTVLQVVSANYSTPLTTTNPTTSQIVSTGLSASITPTSASSKILVMNTNQIWGSFGAVGTYYGHFILQKNGVDLVAQGSAEWVFGSLVEWGIRSTEMYLDSPATTSSTTYSVNWQQDAAFTGSLVRNRNNSTATMILMEIAA